MARPAVATDHGSDISSRLRGPAAETSMNDTGDRGARGKYTVSLGAAHRPELGVGLRGPVPVVAGGLPSHLLLRASDRYPAFTWRGLSVRHQTQAYDEDDDAGKDHHGPPEIVDLPKDHR
jgi:hypothetical protein